MKPSVHPPRGDQPRAERPPAPGARAGWRTWMPLPPLRSLRDELRRNPGLKLVSLWLAGLLWFAINVTERDAERVVELPVTIRKLQPGLIVTNLPTKPVAFTLRGPRTILDGVDEHKGRVALDLGGTLPGDQRIEINTEMVRPDFPRRLKIVRIEPQRLKIRVDRLVRRSLPVRPELAGLPPLGFTVAESHVVPDQVEVTGPAAKVDEIREVTTEAIDLRAVSTEAGATTVERSVLLGWAGDFVSFTPDHVNVTITLEEVMVSREFRHVDVRVMGVEPQRAQLTPAFVDLTIRGPQRVLHNFKLDAAAVTIDASGLGPGAHRVAARVDLPPALEVVRRVPETHQLQLAGTGGGRH